MGADFLFTWIPYPVMTPERESEAIGLIDRLKESDWNDPDVLDESSPEELIEHLKRIIKFLPEYDHRRDVGWLYPTKNGPKYLVTGGMSYGDSPTEAYDDFGEIVNIPKLWKLLQKWAREDARRKLHETGKARG